MWKFQPGIIESEKANLGPPNPLAILSKWCGLFTPDNVKEIWFLKLCESKTSFCSLSVGKDFVTSTGRCEFYSLFLEGNSHCNSNDKILARFIFVKSIKIRFLVLIIWYALKNPRFLSLLPFPPKMCALDLGSSQSPEDSWHFFCLLAPAELVNSLTFIVRSSTVLGKILVVLLCSPFNPSAITWAFLRSSEPLLSEVLSPPLREGSSVWKLVLP